MEPLGLYLSARHAMWQELTQGNPSQFTTYEPSVSEDHFLLTFMFWKIFFPQNLCFVKRLVGTSSGLFLSFRLQPKQHSFGTKVLNSHKMANLPASTLGLPFTTSVRHKILLFVNDPVSGILF